MHNVMALVREHHEDGVYQADKGQRGEYWEEFGFEKRFGFDEADCCPGYHSCQEWDTKILYTVEFRIIK